LLVMAEISHMTALASLRRTFVLSVSDIWPGLVLACVIGVAATFVADTYGGPVMLLALLLGLALHPLSAEGKACAGVSFAGKRVLRLGVALLGARITMDQIGGLGWLNGGLVVAGVFATIAFGIVMSRILGLDRNLGILTGGATAICGASAAMAIAAVLPRNESSQRELSFTIAGITVLSTLAMIVYPVIAKHLGLSADQSGVFIGGTIHDVAQVAGAGYSISHEAGDYAVLTKMLRVAMLLPVVIGLGAAFRARRPVGSVANREPLVPLFLVGFVALVIMASLGWVPANVQSALGHASRACLIVAIAAVGLKTSLLEIRQVGRKAAILLGAEAVFLVAFVLLAEMLDGIVVEWPAP
jgi:uncharacterized integral membrane protein (TIGR00698 family)